MDSPSSLPLPLPLSLSISQHRESHHTHLAVSLSVGRRFDPANQTKMTSSLYSPFKITYYSLYIKLISCQTQKPKVFFQ
jgi:hypothetical protein